MKTKSETRTRTFTVPKAIIGAFFDYTDSTNLKTTLKDCEPPHNIVVDVTYAEEEKDEVMSLIELLDDHINKRDF